MVIALQVITHYPKLETHRKALSQNLAAMHAQAVLGKIQSMQLSEEETKRMVNRICDNVKERHIVTYPKKDGA